MAARRRAREQVIQILYQADAAGVKPLEAQELFQLHFSDGRPLSPFVRELVQGVQEHVSDLDGEVRRHSENWRMDRMSIVDRNILRMSVYELLFREDIPPKVSINEAVDLGKKFGTEDSGAFINGILDSIYKSLRERSAVKNGVPREP